MLPSAIFAVKAVWENSSLEISVSEVFPDGFAFKVSDRRRTDFSICPSLFEFAFFDRAERKYDFLTVRDFKLDGLRFSTDDPAFNTRFRRLLKEYTQYINIKLDTDEGELLYALTGKSYKSGTASAFPSGQTAPCELALGLDCSDRWNAFLEGGAETYFRSAGLYGHPITQLPVTHIHIGSQYCPRLFPDNKTLKRLLDAGVTPVICFPPMPERETDEYLRRAELIPEGTELIINDIGTALMLKGRRFTAGIFLNRRKKDPRMKYRIHPETDAEANRENNLNAEFYVEYLKSLGFTRFSFETTGYPQNIVKNSVLFLPLYRTNTTLLCERSCTDCAKAEAPGAGIIRRFNSLFGHSDEINDIKALNTFIENGVCRLAVNL